MAQAETRKANEYLNVVKAQQKLKELEEDDKIVEYAKNRELTIQASKAEEKRKFDEKQAMRQRMIDKALAEMDDRKKLENKLLNKHIEEARIKAEETEEIKRQKIRKMKAGIDKHRGIYMKNKDIKQKKEKDEDKMFQQYWQKKNKTIVTTRF